MADNSEHLMKTTPPRSGFTRLLLLLSLPGALLLAACETPEYRAERLHCEAEWLQRIPPVYRQELVTRYRSEERATGESTCETKKGGKTHCQQVMKTISVPYTAIETVDIRKAERDPQIASCAARACLARFGNSDCETK